MHNKLTSKIMVLNFFPQELHRFYFCLIFLYYIRIVSDINFTSLYIYFITKAYDNKVYRCNSYVIRQCNKNYYKIYL